MNLDIVRAWKDEAYRRSLSEEQRAQLPESPIGELELNDADLELVWGGTGEPKESFSKGDSCNSFQSDQGCVSLNGYESCNSFNGGHCESVNGYFSCNSQFGNCVSNVGASYAQCDVN